MALLASEYKILKHGDNAPGFTLPAVDGKKYSLLDLKGAKAILIIFMCNHCPYVVPKIKEIKRIAAEYKDQSLIVIGINSNEDENYPEDSFENMKKYAQEWKLNFVYLRDESQKVAKAYGAVCTPDPFLFDTDLKLVYHGRITSLHGKEGGTPELHEVIGEFLHTRKIAREEKPSRGCSIKWKILF